MRVKYNSSSGVQPEKLVCSNTGRKTSWIACIDILGPLKGNFECMWFAPKMLFWEPKSGQAISEFYLPIMLTSL